MPAVEENKPMVRADKSVQTELWASLRVFGQPLRVSSTFGKELILKARFGNLNLGDIIARLVELATHEKGFSLEPPWNVVNQINLSNLILQINLTARKIGIEYELSGLNLVFVKIDSVGVWFSLQDGKSVDLNIVGQFLGQNYPASRPLTWDLLSESPPAVPGSGAQVFDLDYLGIGRHVSLNDTRDLNTVSDVITALKDTVLPVPDSHQNPLTQMSGLKFNPASHWLIGAKFTVIETVTLGAVFNDPDLYGLIVELAGEKAKSFAGLSFQILYKKVTDNIGVYSIVLELPAAMRQLEFGAVSVTLPVVGLDIYTNGNFRIDCGFPKNGDFSISFGIQAFPYIGAGGFYLALLEGATSKTTPQNAPGRFAPVIEFGFGLQLGLGKTIEKGVLKAGLSLTVQGILQGTLAWFEPDDRGAAKDVYYRLEGVVAIVGRLYGAVDFKVISANVSVVVQASAGLVIEAYRPFEITLSVGVAVGVSVRVAFVKVHFSFKMTLTERFTIGSRLPAPWDPLPTKPVSARMPAARALLAGPEAVSDLAYTLEIEIEEEPAVDLNWDPIRLGDPKTLDIYVLVNLTKGMIRDDVFTNDEPQTADKKRTPFAPGRESTKIALTFFAQNSIVPESETHEDYHNVKPETEACAFNLLARGILAWAIQAGSEAPGNTAEVELDQLKAIYRCVSEKDSPHYKPFQIHQLYNFLKENFTFILKTNSDKDISATIFPILPQLQLRTSDGNVERDFATYTPVSEHYHEKIKEFVNKLSVSLQEVPKRPEHDLRARGQALEEKHDPSMAEVIFEDYFMMLMRATLQSAVDFMENYSHCIKTADTLKTLADQFYVAPQSIAEANRSASRILNPGSVIQVKNLSCRIHFSDSLSSIAQKFTAAPAVTASALIAANRNRANILKTGGSLKLTQIEYTVPESKPLGEILKNFQVSMANVRPLDGSRDVRDRPEQLSHWEIFNQVKTYEQGKSLKEIAAENGVPIDALRGLNPRLDPDENTAIVDETEVTIPEIKFTPQAGETLEELACRFEFSAETALKMNRLENVGDQVGDLELYLPNLIYLAPPRDIEAVLKYFGITLEVLVSANTEINFGKPLTAGQTLRINEVNYKIAPNDTFLSIAVYYGSKLENLAADLADDRDMLNPTAVLKIPDFGHQVQSEESLDSIARHYDQPFKDLVAANIEINILNVDSEIIIPDVARLSINTLLDGLANSGKFNHIAAMMSRFLLHGLRLPEDSGQGPATAPTRPLYTLIGQQFDAPRSDKYPEGYVVELSRPANDNWIEFDSTGKAASAEAEKFYLKLDDHLFELKDKLDQIRQFNLIGLELGKIDLAPIRRYDLSPRRFNLRHRIAWQRPDPFELDPDTAPAIVSPSIWKLPANLTEWLETIQMESPPVTLKYGAPDHGRNGQAGKTVKLYRWSTMVNVQVKRLIPAGGTDPLPKTYLLLGTDEAGRRILEKLYVFLKNSSSTVELDLLYPPHFAGPQPGGLQSDRLDISNTQIIKTNLSTRSHSPVMADMMIRIPRKAEIKSKFAASLDSPFQFVRLLRECSVVNSGGFYLMYSVQNQKGGLPGYLFEEDDQANLTLLVRMAAEQDDLNSFHNSVFVLDNIDPAEGLYVAAVAKPDDEDAVSKGFMEKTATISPGHAGFRIERANPENNTSEGDPPAELLLQMLYNLLSFRITENQDFNDSCEGLPAGPMDPADDKKVDKSKPWRYEHVLPIYSFVKNGAAEKSPEKFPADDRDPYRVIGKKCELEFKFQDVFGNRVTPFKLVNGLNLPITSHYCDALIALSQWPAIQAGYDFSKTDAPRSESGADVPAQLTIIISMDAGGYVPGPGKYLANSRTRAKADRETCARVFYQLRQQHVNLYVLNSINGDEKGEIRNKNDFVNFAGHAYAFLGNVQDLESYRYPIVNTNGKKDTLRSVAGAYHLDPVQLAEANRHTRNLFKNVTVTIPVYHIAKTGDTLRTIAAEISTKQDPEKEKIKDVIALNEHVPNVLRSDTPVVFEVTAYETQGNESLTEIADKFKKKYEAEGFEVPIAGIANYNQEKFLNENLTFSINSPPGTCAVQTDMTFRKLADQLSESVAEMAEANKTTKGLFKAGQNLEIPIVYHIKSNDTLTDLTQRYEKLEEFIDHHADNPDLLQAGSRLLVNTSTLAGDCLESIARQAGSMQNGGKQIKISVADIVGLDENLDLPLNPDLEARDGVAVYKQGELIIPGVFEVKTANNSESDNDPSIYRVKETDTLAAIASAKNCTPAELLLANCHHLGLLQEDAEVVIPYMPPAKKRPPSAGTAPTGTDSIFKIRQDETPGSIIGQFDDLTLTALAVAIEDRRDILKTGALMLIPPAPVKIQTPVNTEPYPGHIFPLEVKLRIERDNRYIDSDFKDTPAVQAVETAIQPHQNEASFSGADEPCPLETFARKFETALPNLKLATGEKKYRRVEKKDEKKGLHAPLERKTTKDGARDSKTLWAVWLRTDGGGQPNDSDNSSKQPYNYRIQDRPIFYGLPPISTSLQSRQNVIIPLYEPDKGLATMTDKTVRINFSDIDMDLWARESLGAIDRFLQAEFAVSASRLHPAAFDSILMSKSSLAEAISEGLVPIITAAQDDGDQTSAPGEAFKQELLVELSRAYTTDAVVSYPVQIQAPIADPNDIAPRLCGRPQLNLKSGPRGAALQPEFSASTSKINLARGISDLTFLFSTRSPARQRHVSLDFNFQVNELEFDISPLPEIPDSDYEASSWLRFILPIRQQDPVPVDIPVPLRSYPTLTSLESQETAASEKEGPLSRIADWDYSFSYLHEAVAQDDVDCEVEFNILPPPQAQKSLALRSGPVTIPEPQDLLEALARFNYHYSRLSAVFNRLWHIPFEDLTAEKKPKAYAAIEAFSDLVGWIASNWPKPAIKTRSLKSDRPPPGYAKYGYNIDKMVGDPSTLQATPQDLGYGMGPEPQINSATNPQSDEMGMVTLRFNNLNALMTQTAWSGVRLFRNRKLIEGKPTNNKFIYTTPLMRFSSIARPLLQTDRFFDIAQLPQSYDSPPPPAPVHQSLSRHLQVLLRNLIPAKIEVPFFMKVTATYAYVLAKPEPAQQAGVLSAASLAAADQDQPLQALVTSIPVVMIPEYPLATDSERIFSAGESEALIKGLATPLADALTSWQKKKNPVRTGGSYRFAVSFYAGGVSSQTTPLLELSQLWLDLDCVAGPN